MVVTPEIVIFEVPLFFSDVVNCRLLPSFTFPNERLVGVASRVSVTACPVPERLIARDDGVPFVFKVIVPVVGVVDVGANVALNVVLPPAGIVVDVLNPDWPNPALETVI